MQQPLFTMDPPTERVRNPTTFVDNMKLPIHRWFRFSAGYSAGWVEQIVREAIDQEQGSALAVLDPFTGSGTTVIAASAAGCDALGWEAQGFIYRVAQAKIGSRSVEPGELRSEARLVLSQAEESAPDSCFSITREPVLLQKCYKEAALASLRSLQGAVEQRRDSIDPTVWNLLWLSLVSILRPVSHVGTAQWQYIQPNKLKARTVDAFDGFRLKAHQMAEDIEAIAPLLTGDTKVLQHDARTAGGITDNSIDLVVTSPPYANNFDYADATRLEMTFLGEISSWGELKVVREPLVHACSQHMTGYDADQALCESTLAPIVDRLRPIYDKLARVRETKGGRKAYHLMVVAYFHDMAQVWHQLRRAIRPGGRALFVIGDSAPYGVYVPVNELLGELAVAAGFKAFSFDKSRDRNVKWKNRKHRVPLKEGILEVVG